jgi:hypothetical protein
MGWCVRSLRRERGVLWCHHRGDDCSLFGDKALGRGKKEIKQKETKVTKRPLALAGAFRRTPQARKSSAVSYLRTLRFLGYLLLKDLQTNQTEGKQASFELKLNQAAARGVGHRFGPADDV